jgi:hypothetical protein
MSAEKPTTQKIKEKVTGTADEAGRQANQAKNNLADRMDDRNILEKARDATYDKANDVREGITGTADQAGQHAQNAKNDMADRMDDRNILQKTRDATVEKFNEAKEGLYNATQSTEDKAKAELAQHLAEDPLPLRKAKVTLEAALKKAYIWRVE